jgi:hypothetical protein
LVVQVAEVALDLKVDLLQIGKEVGVNTGSTARPMQAVVEA